MCVILYLEVNIIMKGFLTALLLLSTTVFAEDYLYEYDIDTRKTFFKWYPIIEINDKPYWYELYNTEPNPAFEWKMDGALQFGVRYNLERGYIEFKQEYNTSPVFARHFSITGKEPTAILEFKYRF